TLFRRYSPLSFVCAPSWVPTTLTWALPSGRLTPSTTTRPRIEPTCASRRWPIGVIALIPITPIGTTNDIRPARSRMMTSSHCRICTRACAPPLHGAYVHPERATNRGIIRARRLEAPIVRHRSVRRQPAEQLVRNLPDESLTSDARSTVATFGGCNR